MRPVLTRKQLEALAAIKRYVDEHDVAPSYDELRALLGKRSKSAIHHLIVSLEERGYLRRIKYHARAIDILRLPPSLQDTENSHRVDGEKTTATAAGFAQPETVELELMGSIAAGSPAEAIHDVVGTISVPAEIVTPGGEHFALRVMGESMIEAGILDEDIVIIRRQPTAEFGSIVVALVRGVEATLKRMRRSGGGILLQASNPSLPDQWYRSDEVEVLGQLVGLYRSY